MKSIKSSCTAIGAALGIFIATAATTAGAVDVAFKLLPDAKNVQSIVAALGAELKAASAATSASGVWTFKDVGSDAIFQLRESPSVAWAERISVNTSGAVSKLGSTAHHPRILRVVLRSPETVTVERAKASLVPQFSSAASKPLALSRVRANSLSVEIPQGVSAVEFGQIVAALESQPDVAAVERVRIAKPFAANPFAPNLNPNDPMFSLQWSLTDRLSGINARGAWAAAGTSPVTVAVLDTGYTTHPDLDSKWVPGYDLINLRFISKDGDLRDPDATDEGDFTDYGTCSYRFFGSSWHGTHVAGIIAAQTNNSEGIAGVAPNARIQPVRVLGRCGGLYEDIADGIRWAAGVKVAGIPVNPNPSKVLNLSLGGEGPCDDDMQDAVDSALAKGATIVVSAGNSADDAKFYAPANCKGVITVAASNRAGDLASYSNYGDMVEIVAPGGDFDGYDQIVSTLNSGAAGQSSSFYQPYAGTSMSAPHVAGTIALMLSRDPGLTPGQVLNRLQKSARPVVLAAGSICATESLICGAGLLDAAAAVNSVADTRIAAHTTNATARMRLIELWDRNSNRFMITPDLVEVKRILAGGAGGNWVQTGLVADTFDFTALPPTLALPQPVCRYTSVVAGSVRLAVDRALCEDMKQSPAWSSDGWPFMAAIANENSCSAGSIPVFELFADGRFRYVWTTADRDISRAAGWRGGDIAFCIPAQ